MEQADAVSSRGGRRREAAARGEEEARVPAGRGGGRRGGGGHEEQRVERRPRGHHAAPGRVPAAWLVRGAGAWAGRSGAGEEEGFGRLGGGGLGEEERGAERRG